MKNDTHPTPAERGPRADARSAAIVRDLRRVIGSARVHEGPGLGRYEQGCRYGEGRAMAVACPADPSEVSAIVRYCRRQSITIVPQGAHTGLVAAATPSPDGDQLVVAFERMRKIRHFEPLDRMVTCDAGVLLSELNAHIASSGLTFPIDLGADPSIGGMVATNTGGSRLLRYGDVRHNLLGIEVVLADDEGSLVSDLTGLRKDNSGLDLGQLFVGTGGTFGLVTAASLNLHRSPQQTASAMVVPRDLHSIPEIVSRTESAMGEMLTACEGMSRAAIEAALTHHPALRNPFNAEVVPEYALLVEAGTSLPPGGPIDIESILADSLWSLMDGADAVVCDVFMGRGDDFWAIRHSIHDGIKRTGRVLAFDLSVARSRLPALIDRLRNFVSAAGPDLTIYDFGHFGDGGVHFNLVAPFGAIRPVDEAALRGSIYDIVRSEFDGSISAEHGIGPYNVEQYRRCAPAWKRSASAGIKQLLDPAHILSRVELG